MSDLIEPRAASSGNDKAAGKKLFAGGFAYLVGFSGHKRLVDGDLAVAENCVGADLVSGFKDDNVVKDKLVAVYAVLVSVADDLCHGG